MSASTGVAPVWQIVFTVEQNVRWSRDDFVTWTHPESEQSRDVEAAVAELTARAFGSKRTPEVSRSNLAVFAPVVSQPEL